MLVQLSYKSCWFLKIFQSNTQAAGINKEEIKVEIKEEVESDVEPEDDDIFYEFGANEVSWAKRDTCCNDKGLLLSFLSTNNISLKKVNYNFKKYNHFGLRNCIVSTMVMYSFYD